MVTANMGWLLNTGSTEQIRVLQRNDINRHFMPKLFKTLPQNTTDVNFGLNFTWMIIESFI